MITGMSDRGMGSIIFMIFPIASAAVAGAGALSGLRYAIKRGCGAYRNAAPDLEGK